MRPIRVELEGFLSWREPTAVDLEGVAAGVLVGENGAGKTSIIEALAWALFGKGRGRGPDDFVASGAGACRVVVDFALGPALYRVERQRTLASGGKSHLALFSHVMDHNNGGREWQPIGGDHISETQEAIERLLGLDYDTWVATSFVGQGKADQFTALKPAERKQLLADVLELGRYQTWAERARERERELAGEHTQLLRRTEEIEDFLGGRDEAQRAVDAAAEKMAAERQEVAQTRRRLEEARSALEDARSRAARFEQARRHLEQLEDHRQREGRRLQDEIERIGTEIADLDREQDSVRRLIADLRSDAEALGQREHDVAEVSRALASSRDARGAQLQAVASHRGKAAATDERFRAAKAEHARLAEQQDVLSRSEGEPVCYACRQPITTEHYREEMERLQAALMDLARHMDAAKVDAGLAEKAAAAADRKAQELAEEAGRLEGKLSELQRGVERARGAQERVAGERDRLEAVRARRAELVERARQSEARRIELTKPSAEEDALAEELAGAAEVERQAETLAADVAALEKQETMAQDLLSRATADHARAEESLARYVEAEAELKRARVRAEQAGRERFQYGTLAQAFGRDGIPALIIENAVPQIADEANQLLARMLDGRFRVSLESQAAKKTGGVRETLDVLVSDGADERRLEDLSGGERQAVDIALRVGLSRLLAHRAGRPVRTLILDEAFTALDEGNRQRAVEVLHALLSDYDLVLFVTHLQDLADAFPTVLQVTKDETTSRLEVLGAAGEVAA